MSSPQPTPNAPEGTTQDDTPYYRQVLHALIDQGANLARMVHDDAQARFAASAQARAEAARPAQAEAPPAPAPVPAIPDPAPAFERLARTVRRCIAQAQLLSRPVSPDPARERTRAREALIRGAEDAICRKARRDPGTDTDTLRAELAERLEDPALEFDLAGRPVADVVEDICRDLGVAIQGRSYVWQRRTPADVAHLRARAKAPPGATPPAPHPASREPDPRPGLAADLALAARLARDG